MRSILFATFLFATALLSGILVNQCKPGPSVSNSQTVLPSQEWKDYWLSSGKAELVRYELKQARYGELHKGYAVLVFVTEPFHQRKQVKSDHPDKESVNVLKINTLRRFTTGVYDYSLMSSVFMPIRIGPNVRPLKLSTSGQDWCGHIWTQLNLRRNHYEVELRSYFEDEGDKDFTLNVEWTESEIWNRIRLNPKTLPTGKHRMLPSAVYLRLRHQNFEAYPAELSNTEYTEKEFAGADRQYRIVYPSLKRSLIIFYSSQFPYDILGWKETYTSGWGKSAKRLTSVAYRTHSLRTDYWNRHSLRDARLRQKLGLKKL